MDGADHLREDLGGNTSTRRHGHHLLQHSPISNIAKGKAKPKSNQSLKHSTLDKKPIRSKLSIACGNGHTCNEVIKYLPYGRLLSQHPHSTPPPKLGLISKLC